MAYNYEYPYTDPNRYNADWLINKMKDLEGRLDGIVEEAVSLTKVYVDERLAGYQAQITDIKKEINNLYNQDDEISAEIVRQVERLEDLISEAESKAESLFVISNNRTDIQIQRNNEYIFREIEDNILANITVLNYFTGERVSVQNMFDYLASLHLQNSITYTELANKNLTYNALIEKNITYTELVRDGATVL